MAGGIAEQPGQQKGELAFPDFIEKVREKPLDAVETDIEKATEAASTSNEVQLLTTGPDAFKQLEAQISGVKTNIDINMFSWANDSTGLKMAELVLAAVEKNPKLKVTIRLDKLGTLMVGGKDSLRQKAKNPLTMMSLMSKLSAYELLTLSKLKKLQEDPSSIHDWSADEKQQLEKFTAEVATDELLMEVNPVIKMLSGNPQINLIIEQNPLAAMDHSKVFVFDHKTTFSGGMNIGDEYSGGYDQKESWNGKEGKYWKDYMMKMDGPASAIHRHHFFHDENFVGEKLPSSPTQSRIMVLHNQGGSPPKEAADYAKAKQISYACTYLIDHAQTAIEIEHAYIMDQRVVDKLKQAGARGVKITILRSQPESAAHEVANERFFKQLVGAQNISIIPQQRVMHTKLLRVDGKYSLIGSANLTRESLDYHEEEAVLVIGDSPFQKDINTQFQKSLDLAKGRKDVVAATKGGLAELRMEFENSRKVA